MQCALVDTAAAGELAMVYPWRGKTPKKVAAFRDILVDALRSWL
ncbi:MAG: hypothetical protein U0Q11_03495 [Vicinamibacterales bacterium]